MVGSRVDGQTGVRVPSAALRRTVADLFIAADVRSEDAALAADVLVTADERGVDTHGVSNMLRVYLAWIAEGHVDPRACVETIRETPGTATIDGHRGLGVVSAARAMDVAVAKASTVGVGVVTVRGSRHLGMAAYHAMRALEHDMIGVCATAVGPLVVPTFGAEHRLGTNPIAVAAPARRQAPFVFDAATSAIAGNTVTSSHRLGVPLPGGVIASPDGTPILEPTPAPVDYSHVRLLPLGSTRAAGSHKGYGLACVVEVLASILSGASFVQRLGRGHAHHVLIALDIAAFTDLVEFRQEMDDFLEMLTSTPPAHGHDRVLYAGLEEAEIAQVRTRDGVPLHRDVIDWFGDACKSAGIPGLLSDGLGR